MSNFTEKQYYYDHQTPILVAVDCVIFGFGEGRLKLLLFKRQLEPFKDQWSLIGSFIQPTEPVLAAAARVLEEYTGLKEVFLEELGYYSAPDRDPGGRVITLAHYALLRIEEQDEALVQKYQAQWFEVGKLPPLVLDHSLIVEQALEQLRRKARYRPIGFELLPEKFTIPQLKKLYDAIYQKELDRRNFRKKILSLKVLEKLDEKDKTGSRKGAFLYRFDRNKYEKLMAKGVHFGMCRNLL